MAAFIYLSEPDDLAQDGDVTFTENITAYPAETTVASAAGFPIENVLTSDITELWRSEALGGGSSGSPAAPTPLWILTVDLGANSSPPASQSWDTVAMINHDFPATGTVFNLYSGTTNVLGSMTLRGTFTWREFDMYIRLAAPVTDRFIKIHFGSMSTWTPSMGRLMVGLATENPIPPKGRWSIAPITKASVNRSAFNVKHVNSYCQYHQLNFAFIVALNTPAAAFMTFLKSLQGMRYWFFLIPDSTEYDAYVVRMISQPRRIRDVISHNEFDDVTVEEESRGVRIGA